MAAPISDSTPAGVAVEHAAQGATESVAFPPFDTHNFVPQLVWLVIIFGALYLMMSRIALPRVGNILEARSARINRDLEDATRMQQQASAASAAYDAKLADAKARAQAVAQDTHAKLLGETETRRHALEAELNGKLASAEAQIRETKTRAMTNVESIARDAAATIVEHLTGRAPGRTALDAAVASAKPN